MIENTGSIAILRENGDLIYFDAITTYSERYSGALSTHPLESGGVVTDHTTTNNTTIQLSGIISDADFNLTRPYITSDVSTNWGINNKTFVNNKPLIAGPTIQTPSNLTRLLPESVSQFMATTIPQVTPTRQERPKVAAKIRKELIEMAGGIGAVSSRTEDINLGSVNANGKMRGKPEIFSLVNFEDGTITGVIKNCVFTSLDFTETAETGDALYPVMSIECARFATTKTTTVPRTANKGRKSGKTTTRDTKTGDDASKEATNDASKDARADVSSGQSAYTYFKSDEIAKVGKGGGR